MVFFIGLALLPLWRPYQYFRCALVDLLLSVPFLGERLGIWRILAQLIGLGGVLVMVLQRLGEGLGVLIIPTRPLSAMLYPIQFNDAHDGANSQHHGHDQCTAFRLYVGWLTLAFVIFILPFDPQIWRKTLDWPLFSGTVPSGEQIKMIFGEALIAFLFFLCQRLFNLRPAWLRPLNTRTCRSACSGVL